jgi:hypothetical protein
VADSTQLTSLGDTFIGPSPTSQKTNVLDPTSAQARLDKLQAALDDLANAMRFALRTGQTTALNMFRGQFKEMSRTAAALRAELNTSDQPPVILKVMDEFSDKAIAVAKETGADASALAKGAAKSLANLPVIIVGLAVIAIAVAAVWFLPRRRKAAA